MGGRVGMLAGVISLALWTAGAGLARAGEAHGAPAAVLAVDDPEVREIVARPTLRRRIPRIRFVGDRRIYEFLVSRPPLATQLARRLHPSLERYTVTPTGEATYTIEDRGALRGEARLVAATPHRRVYRFQGEFRSLAHLLRFTGRMVLILDYREVRERGQTYVESDPDFYVRIDHAVVGFMVRLLRPLVNVIIDRRVALIADATRKLFDRVVTDPRGLYREMAAWSDVRPDDLEAYRRAVLGGTAVGAE
jgi:hypothetical protein